jgi:cell fate regulator YaaT (PSP1 superfamily)
VSYLSPISRLSDALDNLERLTEWIEQAPRSIDSSEIRDRLKRLNTRIERLAWEFQDESVKRREMGCERPIRRSGWPRPLRRVS